MSQETTVNHTFLGASRAAFANTLDDNISLFQRARSADKKVVSSDDTQAINNVDLVPTEERLVAVLLLLLLLVMIQCKSRGHSGFAQLGTEEFP